MAKIRKQKSYPGGGPSLEAQRLMTSPRQFRNELRRLIGHKSMRPETRALLTLDERSLRSDVRDELEKHAM